MKVKLCRIVDPTVNYIFYACGKALAKGGRKWYDCWQMQLLKEAVMVAAKLSQQWNRTIHLVACFFMIAYVGFVRSDVR